MTLSMEGKRSRPGEPEGRTQTLSFPSHTLGLAPWPALKAELWTREALVAEAWTLLLAA